MKKNKLIIILFFIMTIIITIFLVFIINKTYFTVENNNKYSMVDNFKNTKKNITIKEKTKESKKNIEDEKEKSEKNVTKSEDIEEEIIDNNKSNDKTNNINKIYLDFLEKFSLPAKLEVKVIGTKSAKGSDKIIAKYDLNSDGIDELVYISGKGHADASAHIGIATYINGNLCNIDYSYNGYEGTGQPILDNDSKKNIFFRCDFSIFPNGEYGSSFVIYTSKKEPNTFYIAKQNNSTKIEYNIFSINKYKFNKDGTIKRVFYVLNDYHKNNKDIYYLNNQIISNEDGTNYFAQAQADVGKILLYSGNSNILKVFEKFNEGDEISKSYNDIKKELE